MEQSSYQRETAYICTVEDLLAGEYVVQEGWKPNYILSKERKLSRVNVMGVVIEKEDLYSFILDDGTSSIFVTDFNQQKATSRLSVGDPVLVIGRPRQSNESLFLACEMLNSTQIKKRPLWLTFRKKQLQHLEKKLAGLSQASKQKEDNPHEKQQPTIVKQTKSQRLEKPISSHQLTGDDIIDFIRKKDDGMGCDIEDITDYFGEKAEHVVHTLITMGEVYEMKPGKIKVLE